MTFAIVFLLYQQEDAFLDGATFLPQYPFILSAYCGDREYIFQRLRKAYSFHLKRVFSLSYVLLTIV